MLKFSLILATVGRREEVARFLSSLDLQGYPKLELIVVDQNDDDRVRSLLDEYSGRFEIVYLQSQRGLSIARNKGLNYVSGDIVCFPDDDCWYPQGLLDSVSAVFEKDPRGILAGQSIDENGKFSQRSWPVTPESGNKLNVWKLAISYTIFMRKECVDSVGEFDVRLGVGAGSPWQSGEETDYLIRAMSAGCEFAFQPHIKVYHPQKVTSYGDGDIARARKYGEGMGKVLRKHAYPTWFVMYMLLRPLGGFVIALLKLNIKQAKYYRSVMTGRYLGWLSGE
ncbi:glycosyltransferase family 2 protein [Litorivivens sp.]|uniref:glycosyltransferase family 2 protein n=1 Tax=Litorivivens sp. TaxID=2020868 RepID=UPI0035624A38